MAYNDVVQSITNAIKDALTLDDVVNGEPNKQVQSRLGRLIYTLATINHRVDVATTQANQKLTDLDNAINTAAAAGAGAKGWIANLVADESGLTQQQINNLAKAWQPVFVEQFRQTGYSDSQTINAALTHIRTNLAGKSTRLVFSANKTYVYDTTGDIRGISNLIINLNGATLKRADASMTKTTLASDIGTGQGTIPVTAIPENWQVGDTLAAYSDTTNNNVTKNSAVITSINRVTNKVYTTGGLGSTATWTSIIPSGATVAKKFSCFSGDKSDGVGAAVNTNIKIINGTIDGNRTNQENYSWFFNIEVIMNGNCCSISNVNFKDTAGECIVGHGIDVNSCRFTYLNGSAFHLSVHDDTVAQGSISRFRNNYVDRVCLATNAVNGHSEGAITFSWGAGRLIIKGNEIKHGSESVFGGFGLEATNPDKWLIIKDNICSDFKQIFHSLASEQSAVILDDNIFSNCGNNVDTLLKLSADISSSVGHNAFVDGTVAGGSQRIREAIIGIARS